jgi:hypothetical protein
MQLPPGLVRFTGQSKSVVSLDEKQSFLGIFLRAGGQRQFRLKRF